MRVVPGASGLGHFVSFFNRGRQQRFVRLLAVPRATARRAKFGNNVAKLRELIRFQILHNERCVPNSEISPEDFLLT